MTNQKALEIANDFIQKMNNDSNLDTRIVTYDIGDSDLELDIQYEYDDDVKEMCVVCSLMSKTTQDTMEIYSCFGIDNPQSIADAIMNFSINRGENANE